MNIIYKYPSHFRQGFTQHTRVLLIICLMIVTYILIATFQSCTAVLHQAIKSIYWVGLTVMYTTLVVSDWCITNLAQGWWVSIQSIVGIFRGWWFPRKPMKILLPLHYSLTQLLSRSTNRIIDISPKKWRNREGEPCMDKLLIATKEMNHAMIMKIHLSQFGSCCQHTRKNLALCQLCGCFINKIGQFSVGFCNQQSFWGPLPDSVRNLTKRVFKSTSLQEKKLHFKSWFGQHWSQGCKQSQKSNHDLVKIIKTSSHWVES